VMVACNDIAEELGDRRMLNMVAVGALLTALPEVGIAAVEKTLAAHMPSRHKDLLEKNCEAVRRGFEAAKNQ
jgi:2-oxoglutarate ferredoxin oxidoreductase subunit gamma